MKDFHLIKLKDAILACLAIISNTPPLIIVRANAPHALQVQLTDMNLGMEFHPAFFVNMVQ